MSRFCRKWRRGAGAALVLGVMAAPGDVTAEPLDKDACGKLQAEKQAMLVLGVDKEFAKGPDWAKANLGQSELNLLKRYLTIDEQLKFRCGMVMVNLTVPDEPEDGADDEPAAGEKPPVPPKRGPNAAAAKPAAKPAAPASKTEPAAAKPAAPAKAAPKPAAPKAQSSWNTEMAPLEADPAATGSTPRPATRPAEAGNAPSPKAPRPDGQRPARGDQG